MKKQLVDVTKYKFIVEPRYFFYGWSRTPTILGQDHILRALVRARAALPRRYNFKIWDMARPRYVQLAMREAFKRRLRLQHPRASTKKIVELVNLFAAKPLVKVVRPDTHRNGGALDLTIVDRSGLELYMGTDHDDLTDRAATHYFEKQKKLSPPEEVARNNRRLLSRVLLAQGFENYAPEWWHWSRL